MLIWVAVGPVALIVALAGWLAFQWLAPRPKLVVSRETTWILEPLLSDGTVDYEAAWRNERSKGLTPENNAGPLLFATLGVDLSQFTDEERAALPKDVVRFEAFYEWKQNHKESLPAPLRDQSIDYPGAIEAVENGEADSPDARLTALWLDANSSSIAEIERDVTLDHMVASGAFRDESFAWEMFEIYPAFRCLAALAAKRPDPDGAFAHLAAGLRLARLQRSLGIPTQHMAADSGEAMVWEGALRIARRSGRVSKSEIRDLVAAADPSDADARLLGSIAAARMRGLDFLVHPRPLASPLLNAEPSFVDQLVARIDPNRACRRLNETADRVEAAYGSGSWSERLKHAEEIRQDLLDTRTSWKTASGSWRMLLRRDALGDFIVDCIAPARSQYVLEQVVPPFIRSERALVELAALAFASETGHDPKSSDDLTPLLFSTPWRDRVTHSAVDFERQPDGTLVARGPLIDLQNRFDEWSKKAVSKRAH